MKKEPKKLAPGAFRCLMSYPWPGNVRELENEMKRLVVLIPRRVITEEDFPESLQSKCSEVLSINQVQVRPLKETVEELEKRLILEALQTCRYNQRQAAKALGLSRWGLIKKMKRYEIQSTLK